MWGNNYLCTYVLYSPCITFWMCAYPLRGEVGGGWAPNGTPLSAHCHFTGPKKTREFQGLTPSHFPSWWICTHPKHYAPGCINHRCIAWFMHTRPLVTLTGCIVRRSRAHTKVTVETAGRWPSWLCGGSQITFLYWTSGPVYCTCMFWYHLRLR
jgi:hypothetical protein